MLAGAPIPARSQKTLVRLRKKTVWLCVASLPYFLGSRSLRTHNLKSGEKERTHNLKSGEKE